MNENQTLNIPPNTYMPQNQPQFAAQQPYTQQGQANFAPPPQPSSWQRPEMLVRILDNFGFFGISSILYGIFFCFCIYQNFSGITSPLLMAGTAVYCILVLKKLDITLKKDSWFYLGAIVLLGLSNCLTDSFPIIFFNYIGILALLYSFLLHNFYEDKQWNFSKYLGAVLHSVFVPIGCFTYPFESLSKYLKKKDDGKSNTSKYIWLGIFISVPLLFVICGLLLSADAVFRNFFQNIFKDFISPDNIIATTVIAFFGAMASYCTITNLAKKRILEAVTDKRTGEPVIAITFTGLLTVIYLIFSVIQIMYLFIGNMTLPDDYTYAAYAREGFFQLLFVCLINLVLVLVCLSYFKESKILKGILTLISLCTYIMIASSAMRMILYISEYSFTFLRVFVLWSLLVIFLVMTGVLVYIFIPAFPLFKYSMVVVTLLYLVFSFSKPDYYITKGNLLFDREPDHYYLASLSTDAIPAYEEAGYLDEFLGFADSRYDYHFLLDTDESDPDKSGADKPKTSLRKFNYSRYKAGKIVESYLKKNKG